MASSPSLLYQQHLDFRLMFSIYLASVLAGISAAMCPYQQLPSEQNFSNSASSEEGAEGPCNDLDDGPGASGSSSYAYDLELQRALADTPTQKALPNLPRRQPKTGGVDFRALDKKRNLGLVCVHDVDPEPTKSVTAYTMFHGVFVPSIPPGERTSAYGARRPRVPNPNYLLQMPPLGWGCRDDQEKRLPVNGASRYSDKGAADEPKTTAEGSRRPRIDNPNFAIPMHSRTP